MRKSPKATQKMLFVYTTVAKKADAKRIADRLLRERLAACVSISTPVESHYRWQGKLCRDKEYLLIIKTIKKALTALEKCLLKIHPYDCPEIVAVPTEHVTDAYAAWLQDQVKIRK